MGNSRPPAAVVDLVDSYARRRNGQIEIVLADPESPIGDNPVLNLRQDERRLRAPAVLLDDDSGRRLVATVPPGRNLHGIWQIALTSDSGPRVRVQARLLVQGPKRPVVLLWGRKPSRSRLPDSNRTKTPDARRVGVARKAAHKVLSALPEQRAEQVRRQVRRLHH